VVVVDEVLDPGLAVRIGAELAYRRDHRFGEARWERDEHPLARAVQLERLGELPQLRQVDPRTDRAHLVPLASPEGRRVLEDGRDAAAAGPQLGADHA